MRKEADVRLLEFFENDGYDINETVGLKLVLVIWVMAVEPRQFIYAQIDVDNTQTTVL